jgi:predicted  nucleic acid-binding Zn-ribbon protein
MPHQCTTCGRTFPDGSKEMLSGCPDCGGNKFQFKPAGATDDAGDAAAPSDAGSAPDRPGDAAARTPDSSGGEAPSTGETGPAGEGATPSDHAAAGEEASATGGSSATPVDGAESSADGTEQIADRSDEDTAQASARSEVVSPDELDRASRDVESTEAPPADDGPRPGIDALRDELNEQFESIRIVSPGQYELNLMELYDRQEYIISLQEDGRYVIEMPDAWGIDDDE